MGEKEKMALRKRAIIKELLKLSVDEQMEVIFEVGMHNYKTYAVVLVDRVDYEQDVYYGSDAKNVDEKERDERWFGFIDSIKEMIPLRADSDDDSDDDSEDDSDDDSEDDSDEE